MNKNNNIAEIIKQLHDLDINETNEILNYIKNKKSTNNKSNKNTLYKGRDGKTLSVGDRVILLTPGKSHYAFEEAYIKHLPKSEGSFLQLTLAKHLGKRNKPIIRKLPKNVKIIDIIDE